jgi:hypothetical protein
VKEIHEELKYLKTKNIRKGKMPFPGKDQGLYTDEANTQPLR